MSVLIVMVCRLICEIHVHIDSNKCSPNVLCAPHSYIHSELHMHNIMVLINAHCVCTHVSMCMRARSN